MTTTYTATFNHDSEIVIKHGGEDADLAVTPGGFRATVIGIPASENWEPEVYDEALRAAGWQRASDWTSDDTATVEPI